MYRSTSKFLVASILLAVHLAIPAFPQVDEISEATGVPIAIGQPVIYGQVAIEGMPKGERRPNVFVVLSMGGVQVDRRQTNERGYYFFLRRPVQGYVLIIEIDGAEIGRANLVTGIGSRVKQDFAINWNQIRRSGREIVGIISASDIYERDEAADREFDRAFKALKEGKLDLAKYLLEKITYRDPHDFFAWTLLGTIHLEDGNYQLAASSLKNALDRKPDFLLALINLTRLELARKDYDAAISFGVRAVERDPRSADANHLLGEALLQAKKGSLAVGFLNKAIDLAPLEKAELHLRLAALYDAAGIKDRAAMEYSMFLKKVKEHPDQKLMEKYIKEFGSSKKK